MLSRARLLSDPNIVNVMPSEPTTQASMISWGSVFKTAISISYTIGNGAKRLCLIKQGSTFTAADLPKDGNIYSYNQTYGSAPTIGASRVFYNGTANSCMVDGLIQDTRYYFMVIEYNEGENGVTNYNINSSSYNPKNRFTSP